jgi:biopolymer transport protein ExbD
MADIQKPQSSDNRKAGVRRSKKLSTKVDLTPMVDLGFLLITFFVFTTSMSKPSAMNLVIPTDGPPVDVAESKTLNLVLSGDNKVHYYSGNEVGNQGCTDFSTTGIRNVLLFMQNSVEKRFGIKAETVILIHPTKASSYGNLIDILDEIQIAGIKKYALMGEPDEQILRTSNVKQPC